MTNISTRTSISTGSGSLSTTIERLSMCYPFVDIVLPSDSTILQFLTDLKTSYRHGRTTLSNILDFSYSLSDKFSVSSDILLLSKGSNDTEDVWCLDHRGLLTLSLTKETYQLLGLVGAAESKKKKERFIVQIDLYDRTSKAFTRAKDAFRQWDDRRETQGLGKWNFLYHISDESLKLQLEAVPTMFEVKPRRFALQDIHVPKFEGEKLLRPSGDDSDEDVEDWHTEIAELFEWVGLACIGSDRLKANDRVDSYISVYEPPVPNELGSVTHLRWQGLLSPRFIHSILNAALPSNAEDQSPSLISVTANLMPDCPISHIPFAAFAEGAPLETRLKRSSKAAQCWSLLVRPRRSGDTAWALATVESTMS